MADVYNQFTDWFLRDGLAAALFSITGFLLALFMVARLVGEKRAPANTFAWILVVVLLPWLGVPLYLLIGGRKLRKIAEKKTPVEPRLPHGAELLPPPCDSPIAHTIVSAGGTPPVPGNTIRLLTQGEDAYAALEEQIRNAKSHIHITTFILSRDDTGRRIVKLLAQKAREGVKVRLLLDFVGSLLSTRSFVNPIRKAGGQVATFMPVIPFTPRGSANLRSHRKIAIFDHCTAIVGGHNLAKEYMGPTRFARRWQDFGAVIEGPAASLLNEVFIQDWCFATDENTETLRTEIPPTAAAKARGETELQVVASGPDVPGDPLYEGIVSMIQEARESIWIVTPYFIPDDVLMRSLIVKARAGRDVTLILPRRSDHPIVDLARRHFVRELRKAGARVLLFGPGMMHSKALIIDDNLALFGSANFDLRSLFVNFEIGVVVHTPANVREIKAWATSLTYRSHPPKPDRKRRTRVIGRIAEEISRLMAPLL